MCWENKGPASAAGKHYTDPLENVEDVSDMLCCVVHHKFFRVFVTSCYFISVGWRKKNTFESSISHLTVCKAHRRERIVYQLTQRILISLPVLYLHALI